MIFFNFYLLSNNSLAQFLDLLIAYCTIDTKVDELPFISTLAENV